MRTILHSLVWKEWHEHKWKLVAILTILCGITSYCLATNRGEVDVLQMAIALIAVAIFPLSIFVGLGDAASERSRDTLSFLQSLPVSTRRVAVWKLAFGLLSVIAPIVLTCLFMYLWCAIANWFGVGYRNSIARFAQNGPTWLTGSPWLDVILPIVFGATSLFIWSAAVGVNRKDEVSAGAAAIIVIIACWLLFATIFRFIEMESRAPLAVGFMVMPGGAVAVPDIVRARPWEMSLAFIAAILAYGGLVARYVRRFGRVAERENFSPRGETLYSFAAEKIRPPFRSPLSAIVWKQARESALVALVGFAAIVGIVAVIVLGAPRDYLSRPQEFGALFAVTSASFGFVIAIVIGIGVCFSDVTPQLNAFWRSRPINPDVWFWCKTLTGLAILLVVIYVPAITALYVSGATTREALNEAPTFIFPTTHLAFFAAAVAMISLTRHAVYAAILSIPAVVVGPALVCLGLLLARHAGWMPRTLPGDEWKFPQHQEAAYYVGSLLLSFVINILIAWLATRFDWGRKSRY